MMQLSARLGGAAILGVFSHLGLYVRGEWHLHVASLLKFYIAVVLGLSLIQVYVEKQTFFFALKSTLWMASSYNAGLFTSVAIYRIFFHRLRSFPGPFLARVTKFWHVWHCRGSQNHLVLERLRRRYGDYVRTGPNELTVFDPAVMPVLQSHQKPVFTKPAWYDFLHPYVGLVSIREAELHSSRRRVWDHSFTTKAVANYEDRVVKYAEQLEHHISSTIGQAFEATQWFYWLTFDVMGDLTFARSFENLQKARWHSGPSVIRRGMSLLGIATPVPWLAQLALQVPILKLIRDWMTMQDWCRSRLLERLEKEPPTRDIFSAIIEHSAAAGTIQQDMNFLVGDAIALIIAGSDTVALTLVNLFYRLALHRDEQAKLTAELENLDSVYNFAALKPLPHLNALINETLRLHPGVPTGGLRVTPPGGAVVNGRFLPGSVTICAPQHSLSRSERCFERPTEFIPDRWTTKPELVKDKSGFAPFGTGKFYCIGKNLGLSELRFVTALLVSRYEVSFVGNENGPPAFCDALDNFTSVPKKLELRFKPRK